MSIQLQYLLSNKAKATNPQNIDYSYLDYDHGFGSAIISSKSPNFSQINQNSENSKLALMNPYDITEQEENEQEEEKGLSLFYNYMKKGLKENKSPKLKFLKFAQKSKLVSKKDNSQDAIKIVNLENTKNPSSEQQTQRQDKLSLISNIKKQFSLIRQEEDRNFIRNKKQIAGLTEIFNYYSRQTVIANKGNTFERIARMNQT